MGLLKLIFYFNILVFIVLTSYSLHATISQTREFFYPPYENLYTLSEPLETYIDRYQPNQQQKTITTFFTTQTGVQEDRKLKGLHKILSEEFNSDKIIRIEKEVRGNLRVKSFRLEAFKKSLKALYELHKDKPFDIIIGEYSHADKSRYNKRIQAAEYVMDSLIQHTSLDINEVRDYILLLTGPDVFSLLNGEPLKNTPNLPGEKKNIFTDSNNRLYKCLGVLNLLKISRNKEAKGIGEGLLSFLPPIYSEKENFYEKKKEAIETVKNSALHQLRIGAKSPEDAERLLNSCDVFFDLSRDYYTASLILEKNITGNILVTKGRAHRDLFYVSLQKIMNEF